MDGMELTDRVANYNTVLLDLGTGDGRYVRTLAGQHPGWFVIGVDACRENLREYSQAKLQNMLFLIASARGLPRELNGLVSHISINFPWGSLLESLLAGEVGLIASLTAISQPGAQIDIRLNGGALLEAGTSIECAVGQIRTSMEQAGWHMKSLTPMDVVALRGFPSTWAKRLAYGRDPRAVILSGQK
jgi:16S rRNA (adenine(1408)-N(1))-methyltransferase